MKKRYLILLAIIIVLIPSSLFAYKSDRVKKVVISSNTEEEKQESQTENEKTNSDNPFTRSSGTNSENNQSLNSEPVIDRLGLSLSYTSPDNLKHSAPYLRLYFENNSRVDLTAIYNQNNSNEYFLIDSLYLLPITSLQQTNFLTGMGFSYVRNSEDNFLLSFQLGFEKELFSDISLEMLFEPLTINTNSTQGQTDLFFNTNLSTRLCLKL